MKRAGRLNWALSFLLTILVAWYIAASVGSRATISAFTALAASLCGFTGGWVGWRTRKAHKRQTPLRQVRLQRCCRTRLPNFKTQGLSVDSRASPRSVGQRQVQAADERIGQNTYLKHMLVLQVRTTSAIASCLWALEVFLQLAKAMLTGGAIATMRAEEKLNKDVIVLCGERSWPLWCPT